MSKLIAVTGNKGKTVFSFYLSNMLALNDKKAVMISTDGTLPVAKMLLPSSNIYNKSLGKLLSLAVIRKDNILDNMVLSPSNKNLGLLSYMIGESYLQYPQITTSNVDELIQGLNSLVDYIIVDTQSSHNDIDKHVLALCDTELCITTADSKGIYYRDFYKSNNLTNILFDCNPYNPIEDVVKTFKKPVKYIIPYCKTLLPIYNGVNITDISLPKKYKKVLDELIKEVKSVE